MQGPSLAALIENQLPDFIVEDYPLVTNFLSKYYEALSIGEGPTSIIQNFEKYLDVDTFSPEILVKTCSLEQEIADGSANIHITVDKTDGFPDKNGLIMIDQEIFLYETKNDTQFQNCIRGYSAKTTIGDLYNDISFVDSNTDVHKQFAEVSNLSNLLLAGLIKQYEEQYTSGFPYQYLRDQSNKNLLVKRIKDFYQVKGTPQSLEFIFQILFSVKPDILYPKENVFKSSESGWNSKELLLVEVISGDIREVVGNEIRQVPDPYNPELTAALAIIDNIVGEPYQGSRLYTLTISPGSKEGKFSIARRTFLMNALSQNAGVGDRIDVFSTIGFPERDGRVVIGTEEITYSSKTATQFIIAERDSAIKDVASKRSYSHKKGVRCFTKNNLTGRYTDEFGVPRETQLRIYGLVSGLTSEGLELESSSLIYGETGDQNTFDVEDGGIPYIAIDNMVEFSSSGFFDDLPLTNEWVVNENFSKLAAFDPSNIGSTEIKNKLLSDVSAIYRDTKNYYIASSGFPSYSIGPFDNTSVPQDQEHLKIIPRTPIDASVKQYSTNREVGVLVNGVPLLNHRSPNGIEFGAVDKIVITDSGRRYTTPPTVNIAGNAEAYAELNGLGEVTNIVLTNNGSGYSSPPTVELSSGSGGQFTVLIQQGQIATISLSINSQAQIIDAGQDYTEPPNVFIYDASGKGKGALFTCQIDVSTGQITGFTQLSGGFDYQEDTTTVTLAPKHQIAVAEAELTQWKFNTYFEETVDNGNTSGIVYESPDINYGYAYSHIIAPTSLKILRADNVDSQGNPLTIKSHSPILGWAYDGNPIYGSFGYDNPYQDVQAASPTIKRLRSSWRIKTTRGNDSPSETTYSLGRFVNDYEYIERLGDLDANNGRFCTTPEFPDGVYAYFMTTDANEGPSFPYSIGEAFYNVPVEENWKLSARQRDLPVNVRRRRVNASEESGELLTSRVSGVNYGPVTNIEVHSSSQNFTNEDVIFVDNAANDSGDGLFAAVNEIQGQEVEQLSCNNPKNNYLITNNILFLNHETVITQNNTGASAKVIGQIEENDRFVVKDVTGTFNLTDTISSTTEIYNLTFDNTIIADIGSEVVLQVQSAGVAHEVAVGKVLRNVFDKNTVIVELQLANPDENTTLDEDGVTTITIPRSSYTNIGYFAIGNGVNIGAVSATIVNIRSLSKDFKLLDIEDNIAVLKTKDKFHGLAVGDDVIVTVEPNSSIATQRYDVETKKYHTIQLNNIERSTAINYSGLSRISIIGAGTSFAPSQTYTGVTAEFFGEGRLGVTHGSLNITTDANGRVATAVIADGGAGYQYGDVVSVAVGTLGGNVQSQKPSFFVDAAGFGYNETELIVDNSNGISTGDIIQITEERLEVVSVTGNIITVIRGAQNTEIVDHLDDIAVELVTKTYRFTKDSVVNFGSSNAYVDNYDPSTQQLDVYYVNEGDQIIADNSIFVDESTPTKQAQIDSVTDTSLRFRFRKDGESEWFKNISLDIQRTYRYIFDTSSPTLVGRHLKFYENVYRTRNLLQAFESIEKPGFSGSYTSFQLGYGIPIDGTNWEQKPVIAVPPKIYYDEPLGKINSEDQFFTLVEDPFAGKHAVFYGFEYEFAYRLPKAPQQEGFSNVQYFTDSLYAIGSIKNVKVISGGKNFTLPPQLPGVFLNKRFRGAFTPLIEDGKITSVNIIDTGLNYSQPKVLLENTGGGANAQFRVELTNQGAVGRIVPTEEGSGYGPDTTMRLYESDAKLYAHGENIGRLATLEIISSGKNFNNDPSLLPQVNPPIVMTLRNFPDRAFLNGEQITQRDANGKMIAFGRVDYWINGMNILRIKQVQGKFDQRYPLYGEALRSTADIQKIYVAKIDPVIGPTSTSIGNFQTDRSKLSAVSQKIQDGIYYQDYSYVVKSTISINDWRDFVKKFTHPAGFNLFGEVLIESFGDAEQPATIDTPQSGTKDNGFGAVISIIEPGVLGVTTSHKATRITQSHVRVDTFRQQRGLGTLNYSERNNVEIEVFDLAVSPEFDGVVQVDGSVTGTRTFTLFKKDINEPLVPYKAQQLLVTLDGVLQDPDTAYTVSGSTITFAEAPLGPFVDAKTGINVPGVNFYGKSIKFQDNINNDRYMIEANNITSQFDGTSTNFDLGIEIVNDDHVFISLDGVLQEPGVAYNLVEGGAGEVTFTEPPRQVGKILELDITDATNFLVNDFVVGQTSGARGEIVAKRYFVDHRFLNAANLLADNSTILAEEAVGILDDTSKFDGFTYPGLGRNQCITDLKSVLKNISRDLQLGGNSNTWDAAKEYLLNPADPNSDLKHIEGEVEATLWAMKYFKDMSILTIRNHFGIGNLTAQQRFADTTFSMTPTNALYTASNGTLVLTIPGHELSSSDKLAIADNSLTFTCAQDNNQTQHTYPRSTDPISGIVVPIVSISGDNVTINVSASPSGQQYDHTFVSSLANSVGKYNDVYNKTNAVADEFIDSANLLSANRNFIAEEAVAMMLANPANSGFTIPGGSVNCVDDVKDMLKAITWNLQYGGNNKTWDAAELYIDRTGALEHITGQITETLEVFTNVKTLAADVIRNVNITPVGAHGVTQVFDNSITVETNECASVESAIGVLVDLVGNAIQTPSTFESNVARTLPLVWPTEFSTLTPTRDLTITIDAANPYCQQVESAVNVLFNIVTTTISEAAFNNTNHLLNVAQDFPNPNRIQVEMTKKDFLQGEDIQSEASLLTATIQSVSSINPGIQQKFFGFKQGKYYKLDSIESQFNDAQTIFDLERNGVPFYSERSQNLVVILNGVMQVNRVAYRVEDNLVVFNEAPAFGSACFILYFYGLDPERVLIGYNIEPPGTFKKFFKLTLDQQILLPLEGAQCWVSTEPVTNIVREYPYSFARGRIYKQAWTPGQQNVLFVEGVTAQKSNWLNGTLSVTRDRGSTAPIIEMQILDVEEQVNEDFREKLFNRQDRIKSNLSQGDLIKIDGEAETRSIVRAARDALVTSGYDSDTSGIVSSFFRSYEYEVVLNVGPYSGQIEGFGAQAIAKIDAEVRFHTLQSSRTEGVEFLPGDEVVQYQDQNDTSSPVIWRAVVKAYAPKDKAIEFRSEYIDGTTPVVYTDPDVNTFRTGERIYVEATPSTNAIALQYLEPGGVNRVVLTRRDNSAYYESFREWKQANVWNKGENLLGNGFVPMNASANNEPGEYDFTSSIYDDQLNPQISKNYREPPVMIFRSSPVTDSNGDSLGSPTGGGARATAIVVRGEIVDTELISSGSGYKVPPQILFTRGYFVFRKDPLSVTNFTTFGIEPPTIDSPVGVQSFLQTIFKGGDNTRWTLFNSYAPAGDNLVFGNAGAPIYQVKKYYDGRVIIQKILDLTNKMHPQPEIYINLAPEDVRCYWKETTVLQSQMTGGVQGISCALTKYKKTETKVQYNAGVIEKRAFNNLNLIGFDTYNTGSLGLTIGSLESMKFEIQPQSNNSIGQNGYYTDSAGRQINYVMGDMNLDFWSNLYPNLTIEDFENPDILNSQVYAEGDQNYFRYQQGSEIHFRTTSKAMILDNTFGDDVLLVNSTKGFPASGGKLIIADVAADKREEMTYTSSTSDRFLGVQRLNPLSTVEEGSRFAAMTNTKYTQYVSLTNSGTGLSYNGGFISDVQYYLFYGGNVGSNRIIHWTFSTANEIQSFQNHNTITVEYIRGTGSNGGEYPGQDLELWFWSANTNYVKAGNVWSSGDAAGGDWSTTTLNIPATIQTEINNGNAYRMYFQQLSIQAGGADYFGLRTWWLDDTDGEPTYPKGTVVMSANKL
jgi:hypothetical protein